MKAAPLERLLPPPRRDDWNRPPEEPTHPSRPRRDPQPYVGHQHIAMSGINYDPRKKK
jgi:hypothetical protein